MRRRWSSFAVGLLALSLSAAASAAPPIDTLRPQIIGGVDALDGQFPFLISLQKLDEGSSDHARHWCGGSRISDRWMLIAAHCVDDVRAQDYAVLSGATTLASMPGARASNIKAIHVHPAYGTLSGSAFDVALIELRDAADGPSIPMVLDGDADYLMAGQKFTVAGWGDTDISGGTAYPRQLQTVQTPVRGAGGVQAGLPGYPARDGHLRGRSRHRQLPGRLGWPLDGEAERGLGRAGCRQLGQRVRPCRVPGGVRASVGWLYRRLHPNHLDPGLIAVKTSV